MPGRSLSPRSASGKIPAFVDTGLYLVHGDDVAEGHFLALDRGSIGERYILGGHRAGRCIRLHDVSRYRMYFGSDKARRVLGYQPRAYQEGLRDALAWFRAAGYLHGCTVSR